MGELGAGARATAFVVLPACMLACTLLTGVSDLHEVDASAGDASFDAPTRADTRHVDVAHLDVVAADHSKADVHVDFCASQSPAPLFCCDFDTTPMPWGWDSVQTNMGSVALDDAIFESAPHSLQASTVPESTGYLYAMVQKAFTQPLGDSKLEFDMYFDTIDPDAQYDKLLTMTLGDSENPWTLYFQMPSAGKIDIATADPTEDGGVHYNDYEFTGAGASVVTGKWIHVEIDTIKADSGAGIGEIAARVDGALVLAPVAVDSAAAVGAPTIQLGLSGIGTPTGPWELHLDDVTFEMN
jgi:hypothetical protein